MKLADFTKLYRSTDPPTSRIAAKRQVNRETHLRLVLRTYETGAQTDVEASQACGLDRIETTRRASELRNEKLIEPVLDELGMIVTRPLPTNRPGMVCRITDLGREALQ